MSRRITASVAKELITFAKSIKVRASHYDNKSTSAYEFYRQIGLSPKLKAANPDFEASFTEEINDIVDPTINCEFTDGSKLDINTSNYNAMELKSMFYDAAEKAEQSIMTKKK